jgi:uncharacterized Zn finger protein
LNPRNKMKKEALKRDLFGKLTWDDLQEWAGSRVLSRGQSYQRSHRVKELAQTQTESLVAWVQGGQRYATEVDFEEGELISICTCPYGNNCKHAVAVVLEYLEHVKKNKKVPQVSRKDKRLVLLRDFTDEQAWDDEDEEYEGIDHDELAPKKSGKTEPIALRGFLEQQNKEQLIALIEELAGKHSIIRGALQDRYDLSKGSVRKMVNAVRKEIHELSEEPGWTNHWRGEGHIPDYSRVKDRMNALLKQGYADEVFTLGRELLEAGIRQVEMSHDEGETGMEISSCLEIVFQALSQSALSPVEQMLWVIDAELEDEYELCYGSESFWKKKQKASDWSAVADKLIDRLKAFSSENGEDDFSRNYRRDNLTNWIIRALENSGRHGEIIPLCEQEAVKTGSYTRLVKVLRKANRSEEAEQWIHKGIKATQKQWPGVASQLRDALREMREKEGNWLQVAAFRAEDFLGSPSLHTYEDMKKSAERAKVWPSVREGALRYLETGKLPQADPSWPLPETGVIKETGHRHERSPMIHTLIDIAIAEKRTDDVLRWYDHPKSQKGGFGEWDGFREDTIAEALKNEYPDRALSIWKNLAEKQIALTKPSAYETAAGFLRKARDLVRKLKREDEWKGYLSELRQVHARKIKLLEILDRLEGRRIVEKTP